MNTSKIDFNLLYVFHTVMAERSMTRAAQRLAMTQSAVSNAVKRLRAEFKDELFTRVRSGVQPTERAIALWPDIRDAFEKIKLLIAPKEFDPATATHVLKVAISDALRYGLVPRLAAHVTAEAPNVKLHLFRYTDVHSIGELESGLLDCAVGMISQPPPGLHVDTLFADEYVCVLRKRHPLLRHNFTLRAFAAANHVLVRPSGRGVGIVDTCLSLQGLSRRISLVVNTFADALDIVRNTDVLTAVPRMLEPMALRAHCVVIKLPFETHGIIYKMVWNDKSDAAPEQIWLRKTLKALLLESSQKRAKITRRVHPNAREFAR